MGNCTRLLVPALASLLLAACDVAERGADYRDDPGFSGKGDPREHPGRAAPSPRDNPAGLPQDIDDPDIFKEQYNEESRPNRDGN